MTVHEFDPAFSRDLRQELVSRSDAVARVRTRPRGALPQRRALLTTIVTAVVLLITTLAVLQAVRPAVDPAAPATPDGGVASTVVDPLTVITDPAQGEQFLSRSPDVLLHVTGADGTAHAAPLRIPAGVTTVRIWLNCTDGAHFALSLPRHARTGSCASSDATPTDATVRPGSRVALDYAVPEPAGAAYALLVVALPADR